MYAKKFFALLLSAALMVSMLAGCNKQPDDGEGDGSSSSSSQGTSQNGGNGGSGNSGSQGGGSSSGGESEQPDEDEKPGEDEDEPGDEEVVPVPNINLLDLVEINSEVKKSDSRITVENSSELNTALVSLAERIEEAYNENELVRGLLYTQMAKYFKAGTEDYLADIDFVTEENLKEGFRPYFTGYYEDEYEDMSLHSLEDIIIQDTLYMERGSIKLLTYAASAVPATTADGVSGYLFALIFN